MCVLNKLQIQLKYYEYYDVFCVTMELGGSLRIGLYLWGLKVTASLCERKGNIIVALEELHSTSCWAQEHKLLIYYFFYLFQAIFSALSEIRYICHLFRNKQTKNQVTVVIPCFSGKIKAILLYKGYQASMGKDAGSLYPILSQHQHNL